MFNSKKPDLNDLPSSRKLLQSTGIALMIASVVLTVAVLPAEYGIDVTGIGKILNLTRMGEIKTELAQEASKESPFKAASVDLMLATVPSEEANLKNVQATNKILSHEKTLVLKPWPFKSF